MRKETTIKQNFQMNWIHAFVAIVCIYTCEGSTSYAIPTSPKPELTEEDLTVVNESIKKYGPVRDFYELNLPGPELRSFFEAFSIENKFEFDDEAGNYTLKLRGLTPLFGYNRRYEEGKNAKRWDTPMIKGHFSEHFKRESGGFYVRTIGYILDEDGYREFLLDISRGEQGLALTRISSAALASLTGGGLG